MIGLFSPTLNPADSYGVIAHHLIAYLSKQGVQVDARDFLTPPTTSAANGALYLGLPTLFYRFPVPATGPRIAITMFETSVCPPTWVPVLNQMNAVIVPSEFCYDTFKRGGVKVPLHMFSLGVGDVYQPVKRPQSAVTTFLAFFDQGKRKGGLTALNAFLLAFGSDPRYQLILKKRATGDGIDFENPNIRMIQADMSEQELYQLYCACDCMIAANHGEGFGLLPREFAATGGIALATNWAGTSEQVDQWGVPIPHTLKKADYHTGLDELDASDLGEWAVVDPARLAVILRRVASSRVFYLTKAQRAARKVRKLYSWERFCAQVCAVLKEQ